MSEKTVLCVDDDLTILRSLRDMLSRVLGSAARVEIASNGFEAIEFLKELQQEGQALSLIIADFIMPRMRGDELLVTAHNMSPDTVTIMLTGQSDLEGVKNAINNANLYRFLEKPFNNADMVLTVRAALDLHAQRQELALLREQHERLKLLAGPDLVRQAMGGAVSAGGSQP